MKQIDMIKAFAELEGVDTEMHGGCVHVKDPTGLLMISSITYKKYNPITDLALSMKAVFDYKVDIVWSNDSEGGSVLVTCPSSGYEFTVDFDITPELAIIECILKSAGKWHEH